jgi:hypothetical protein
MITVDDFNGLVPNLTNESQRTKIENLIKKYEKPFMVQLLGLDLAKDVSLNPEDYETLIEGDEWSNFGGIREIVCRYIYFFWLKDSFSEVASNGTTVAKHENSEAVSPYLVMCDAWNNMRMKHIYFEEWLEANPIELYDGTLEIKLMTWL